MTQRNYGGGLKYDYFASQKLYYLGNLSAKVDREAGLDLRTILGADQTDHRLVLGLGWSFGA